ncbi:MAG: carbamate kinase [Candidatus Micrarchaeota archaeon]|nr:carbamate kinase [Candidatus Micrarchaeota archaeon]
MRYVIAVGGNALRSSKVLNKLSAYVALLSGRGDEIVITHGNGPQVGALALHSSRSLALLTKQTEAQVGAEIRRSLERAGRNAGAKASVVYTRVVVSARDPEFANPTKPIGEFYQKAQAVGLARHGFVMKHLLKGYRRVVPSPRPMEIVELKKITGLLRRGRIVITAGGGGIAVTRHGSRFRYANAVIDKDLASALLATRIKADALFILTNVDGVFTGFHTRNARLLRHVSASRLRKLAQTEHFEPGSVLPKVMACISFVQKSRRYAVVGSLSSPRRVMELKSGTLITSP